MLIFTDLSEINAQQGPHHCRKGSIQRLNWKNGTERIAPLADVAIVTSAEEALDRVNELAPNIILTFIGDGKDSKTEGV